MSAKDPSDLEKLRHSAAHLLAAAVLDLYPDTKPTIGPAIENGFYYDFQFANPISEEDLAKIEKRMGELLPKWSKFSHKEISAKEARELFKNNQFKVELIDELEKAGEQITVYECGGFTDLCRGGHSENPAKDIGAFKLLSIAGAYWRGNEKNPMLTRIYGTAFSGQQELDTYLHMLEEAKARDHKKLGPLLDLFAFDETAPGMVYWLPKGLIAYNVLYDFARQMYRKYQYQEIATPQLNKKDLYETSGHWQHYRDDMFIAPMSFLRGESEDPLQGGEVFGIKPMNCPNAMRVFKMKIRSYNDLPLRLGETSLLHRFELSGTLNGLFRTRQFRQDDAHIYLSVDQIESEFQKILAMIEEMYAPFGLSYRLRFGTRPDDFMGEPKDWDVAEAALKKALAQSNKDFFEAAGEGAFYGPKVDILMKDTLGREWQTGTIQLDFQQPKNFGLKYTNSEGKEVQPAVFHRAIFGSFERFFGILIEHFAGALPTWLSPTQVVVIPIADRHNDYANKVLGQLVEAGIRTEVDDRSESMQNKIRFQATQKVPYLLIVGDKEVESATVSVRGRENLSVNGKQLAEVIAQITAEIDARSLTPRLH